MKKLKRKKKKNIKNTKKKEENTFKGEAGFMYPFGYVETDPYIFLGKKVFSIFDVTVAYGEQRPAPIGWTTRLVPSSELENGKVMFFEKEKGVNKKEEDTILQKQLSAAVATMAKNDEDNRDVKEMSKNSDRVDDYQIAASLAKNNIMIDTDMIAIFKADTPEKIEATLHELKTMYKNDGIQGIMFTRRTGQQMESLQKLLTDVTGDLYHNTDMSEVAASRLFLPSVGFSDSQGVMVGRDIHSLIADNTSLIDFSTIRNAVIYTGGVKPVVSIGGIEGAAYMQSGGTALAHVLADGQYLSGGRTHYIVLTKNGYHTDDSLYFNMKDEAINPFEVFGKPDTVEQDANANFDKINTMFLMAAGVEDNEYIKANLKNQIIEWFIYKARGNGIYTDDPKHNPVRAQRILASEDHENYPKPSDFVLNLHNMVVAASNTNSDELRDMQLMYRTIDTLVTTHPSVFDKATTLPNVYKSKDRNIYYDLSQLGEDPRITAISFLNVLAYVTNRALPGETIVIVGLDEINLPVESLRAYRERMNRKNINLITVFEKLNNEVNPVSYETFTGRLSQQDMVVLGGLSEKDVEAFGQSWQQELPPTVRNQLLAGNDGIFYFYRKSDHVGALVDTHLIL